MTQTRTEFVYSTLRDRVCSGEIPPGAQLVNRTLGKELGVSTITVREAIHRLVSEGLIQHVPNAGAYARDLGRKEMVDLLLFRGSLDCFVVEQATRRISEYHLTVLEKTCGEWRSMIAEMRSTSGRELTGSKLSHWLELDERFHVTLVQAADNAWLTKAYEHLNLIARVMRTKAPTLSFGGAAQTYRHHLSIARSLRKHDEDTAGFWMRVHGKVALHYLLSHIDDTGYPHK